MKSATFSCFMMSCMLFATLSNGQAVAINDDASLPHPSAILDVKVSTAIKKGILIPRMTAAQRAAIPSPGKGLLVYDSTNNSFWFHNGIAWQPISSGGANPWTVAGTNIYNSNTGNVGIGVVKPVAKLHVGKTYNVLFGGSLTGLGAKAFWLSAKAAFRAGYVDDPYSSGPPYAWDPERIGFASFAAGSDAEAVGDFSVALGRAVSARGVASFAQGVVTNATGDFAAVFGEYASAVGTASFAANNGTAGGMSSAAFGNSNIYGDFSFGAGDGARSFSNYSVTFGHSTHNYSSAALVFGEFNDAISVAGTNDTASISPIFIIGNGTGPGALRNAFVTLRNGTTSINKNPGVIARNDGMLQIKQLSSKHALTLEAAASANKWSFNVTTNMTVSFNNALRGTFNSVTGNYVPVSDARLKKDINFLPPVLDDVMQLNTYSYHLLDNEPADNLSYGLMAQEVQKIFPNAVSSIEGNDGNEYFGVNYSHFTVIAIKAIQEQQVKIDEQARILNQYGATIAEMKAIMLEQQKTIEALKNRLRN